MSEPTATTAKKRSFDVNQVVLCGRVGRSDLRKTTNGHSVLSFSVATNEIGTDGKEHTSWANCCVWGNYGDTLASRVQAGARVACFGQLRSRSYEKDGQKREVYEVVCEKVIVEGGASAAKPAAAQGGNGYPASFDDPLPL